LLEDFLKTYDFVRREKHGLYVAVSTADNNVGKGLPILGNAVLAVSELCIYAKPFPDLLKHPFPMDSERYDHLKGSIERLGKYVMN